ncbi:uncharacterized protein LOC122505856 [Leptopilina heterotoma]|uniref:uncharacterized protein LOC122505856 n=1 Tax=Leptopilina heterotoma TaxID=63436 RepID=UPI001CA9CC88|nr:uncharacterized protein LOC122505856 [Leptopilina heterotoma]
MAFSNVPDTRYSWLCKYIKETDINNLREQSFYSPQFSTSEDLKRKWCLCLSIRKNELLKSYSSSRFTPKYMAVIDIKLVCNENVFYRQDMKVNVSVIKDSNNKIFQSFVISGNGREFGCENFTDYKTLIKMLQNDYDDNGVETSKLEIMVEFYCKIKEDIKSFEPFTNSEFLSDFQIFVQGETFYVHKIILARRCPYFYKIFEHNENIKEIVLDEIKSDALRIILKYVYSEETLNEVLPVLPITEDVLFVANYLQMEAFKTEGENYFKSILSLKNVVSILSTSIKCSGNSLKKHCLQYIVENFNDLGECFQSLQTESLSVLSILKEIFNQSELQDLIITKRNNVFFEAVEKCTKNAILEDYESFFNDERFSDITIYVGNDVKYQCHKVILSARSPQFLSLFTIIESTNTLWIRDTEPDVFSEIMRYIYTGEVKNLEKYGKEIFLAAKEYALEGLMEMCEKFLANKLTTDNVMNLIQFADANSSSSLVRSCVKFIVEDITRNQRNYVNTLDTFLESQSNILYEILNTLFLFSSIELKKNVL